MDVIEQRQISRRFARALPTYDRHAEAQQRICRHLIGLLRIYTTMHFGRLLEIGCGSGGFTRLLQKECQVDEWLVNDLCEPCGEIVTSLFRNEALHFLPGDAEVISLPYQGATDLIASASAFQWMKDQQSFFRKLSAQLASGGTLLFNTFTPDNLHEIRTLTGKGLDYPKADTIRRWIEQAGLRLVHEETEMIRLTFDTPLEVLRHLKYTGVTATNNTPTWTRQTQQQFCEHYRKLFTNENRKVTLTYSPLYILAVKP